MSMSQTGLTDKRQGGTLQEWRMSLSSVGTMICHGRVYGDSHWPDGEFIRTSSVMSVTDGELTTLNTIYELGRKEDDKSDLCTERQ